MRRIDALSLSLALGCGLLTAPVHGAALLLNPGDATGYVTTHAGTTPYAVAAGSTWNEGAATYGAAGVLRYANGTTATGVSAVVAGGAISSNAATINFASPNGAVFGPGAVTSGLFNGDPAEDAVFVNNSAGVLAMRVTGLAQGTYDVYVVAAYCGQNTDDHPGKNLSSSSDTPAAQGVWVFAGTTANSLNYNYTSSEGRITGAGSTALPSEILENWNNTAWTENDNYEKLTVTLTVSNPTLYIATTGHFSVVGGAASGETRPWLSMVQVVPEPSTALLLASATAFLIRRRRA